MSHISWEIWPAAAEGPQQELGKRPVVNRYACGHKLLGISLHGGPPEALTYEGQGASHPRMAGQVGGIAPLVHLRAER